MGLCGGGAPFLGFSDPNGVCWVGGLRSGLFAFGGDPLYPLRDKFLVLFYFRGLLEPEWGWEGGMAGDCLPPSWCSLGSEEPWSSVCSSCGLIQEEFSELKYYFWQPYKSASLLILEKLYNLEGFTTFISCKTSGSFHKSLWLRILLCVNLERMWLLFSTSLNQGRLHISCVAWFFSQSVTSSFKS